MSIEKVEALVVGCGQAGLAMSEHLSACGVPHLVLERHRIAERWRSERWDSLVANGPAWHDRFPGLEFSDMDPDAFAPKERVADYFVFTMVRNPWDRMVSYYHWLRAQRFDHPAVRLAARLDFSAFLAHPETAASVGRERAAGYVSIGGRDLCNAYIRLEHLDEDIAPLEDHLGFSLRPLPHENRSERERDYSSYYTDEDAGRVARLCAEDIKKFAYRF